MASLLQKSTPWIEDSFVYACSFDANSEYDGLESDGLDSDLNDDEEIIEPQTDNTIPAGLLGDDDSRDGSNGRKNKPPPTRGGKIVQIIDRGGDPNFYVMKQQQQSNGNHNHDCCPPYLILHDGKYSTIAFLSEEAYNSSMMRQDVASIGTKQPKAIPRKSLISVSQYTISTIKCCAQSKEKQKTTTRFKEDVLPIQLVRPDMPRDHLSQVQMSINTNLLLCLYLLGPITFIGAENQGLIGDSINVNCSIKVRRVLISHMSQFDRVHKEHTNVCVNVEEEEEEEDYQHWTMVQRLEACHCYYQLLEEKKGGTIPVWPWESRLVDGEHDDGEKVENAHAKDDGFIDLTVDPAASATTAAVVASPGRVERMIRKYENLEELLQKDGDEKEEAEEVVDDSVVAAAVVGDTRAGRASTGTYLAKWDSEEEEGEKEDAVEDQRTARASTGTYLANWDSEDEKEEEEEEEMEDKTKGNTGEQVQQQEEQDGEEGEKEKDTNTKEDDSPIEQGNVAELFDNFQDINDVLDLEEDEPVIAEEEDVSASTNAMLESNENNDVEYLAEHGEDNEMTEKTEEMSTTQDDNAATFVGIDQMIVDSDDDEGEEDEHAPLLTQQEINVYKDDKMDPVSDIFEPSQEDIESQILLPPVKANKKPTKLSRGHGHLKRYVDSQIPFPLKGTQSSDEEDGGTESQIPFPPSSKNRQSLHESDNENEENSESDNENEENSGDIGTESQIPFLPRRKQLNPKSSHRSKSEDEEVGCNIMAESQIPLPPRRKQHIESLDHRTDDQEGTSQVLSPQKQLMKKASPRKPNRKDEITYDSEDDWMRIRRNVRPSSKPTNRAPRVQSQMAGEGSEEIVPTKVLDTSQIYGFNEDEAGEEDVENSTGISKKEMNQLQPDSISPAQKGPSSSGANTARSLLSASSKTRATDHRVRFAMEVAAGTPIPPPVNTQRELFTSVSNKASKILLQSSRASNEPASRKRKADEDQRGMKQKREFSFGNMFDRVKRLWPSHSDDDDEEEEV